MAKYQSKRVLSASEVAKTILRGDPRKTGREVFRSSRMMHYVGAFIDRYGAVEVQITRVFSHVLEQDDFERFEALVFGMDLPRKVQGLRSAMRFYPIAGGRIGPNIDARLKLLREITDMRNNLVHSYLELRNEIVWCNTLGRMTDGWDGPSRPLKTRPKGYTVRKIVSATLWLHDFFFDLNDLAQSTHRDREPKRAPFELGHPRTKARRNFRPLVPHPGSRTSRGKLGRKPP